MDKRFIAFVVASVLIMTGFMLIQTFFGPKPQPKKPIPLAEKKGDKDPAKSKEQEKKTPPKTVENGEKKPPEDSPAKTVKSESLQPKPQWISLGSLDPASPYRMLVTLNNRGAAVERIELNNPLYLDLGEERHFGYLGHLALTKAEKGPGCVINVVGHGTPAAKATADNVKPGLQAGDVLLAVDGETITDPADLPHHLTTTKPKQNLRLSVRRNAGGGSTNLEFVAVLTRRPLEVVHPEFGSATDAKEQHPLSLLTTLHSIGPANLDGTNAGATKAKRGESEIVGLPSLLDGRWKVKELRNEAKEIAGVEFRFPLDEEALQEIGQAGKLEVVKTFRLAQTPTENLAENTYKSYHLEFDLEIVNQGAKPQQISFEMRGPNGLPLEGWWYQNKIHPGWASAGARDVIWSTKGLRHSLMGCPVIYDNAIAKAPKPSMLFASDAPVERRKINYVGVDAQYFTAALVPYDAHEGAETSYEFDQAEARPAVDDVRKDKSGRKVTNVSFQLISPAFKIEAGKSFKQSYLFFAGPKEINLLDHYGLDKAIEYGWFPWVAKPLSWILHRFYGLIPNYGIAIIMLTILVRACLLPIGRKMAKNMQAMQDLAPEIKALKEKYKDDLAKQGKAQQELFRKYKINPYAGCLPLFLQMPIFIGLYRALSVDISLRQAELIPGLLWASNLAGPDMLWKWQPFIWDMLGGEAGYLGPYLNVFPLVTATLFLVQQYLFTPPPTDEQQVMQQKMMYFMTIFMSVMFFKVPAGLCVYFITSSLWGIAERTLMIPKRKPGAAAGVIASKKAPDKPGSNGVQKKADERKKQKNR